LNDIRTVFNECNVPSLSSKEVCNQLVAMEESSWESWRHGRPLSPVQLARLLRPFEIESRDLWQNKRCLKGYAIEDFRDAFDRYLPSESSSSLQPGVSKREDARTGATSGDHMHQSARTSPVRASQSVTIATSDKASRVLADRTGGMSKKVLEEERNTRYEKLSKMWRRVKAIKQPRR
jgi:hypothetical protein